MMRTLVLSGVALAALAAVGTAKAGPVALPGDQLDQVTAAGGGLPFSLDVAKNVRIDVMKNIAIRNLTESLPVLQGNFNDSEASATAIGKASYTQTLTLGEAVQNQYSRGYSESVAAANRPYRAD
jgi:hypothetical protein